MGENNGDNIFETPFNVYAFASDTSGGNFGLFCGFSLMAAIELVCWMRHLPSPNRWKDYNTSSTDLTLLTPIINYFLNASLHGLKYIVIVSS